MTLEELRTIVNNIDQDPKTPVRVRVHFPEGYTIPDIESFAVFSNNCIILNVTTDLRTR